MEIQKRNKNERKSMDDFWREYEESTGEKVQKRSLGKYISGWDEFDEKKLSGIWGLIISTTGGFRFHHFPQNTWIDAFTRFASREQQKEKTIFIPREKIVSIELIRETKWWKKLLSSCPPRLIIKYTNDTEEKHIIFEVEHEIKQAGIISFFFVQ